MLHTHSKCVNNAYRAARAVNSINILRNLQQNLRISLIYGANSHTQFSL